MKTETPKITIPRKLLETILYELQKDNALRIDATETLLDQIHTQPRKRCKELLDEYTWQPNNEPLIQLIQSYLTINEYESQKDIKHHITLPILNYKKQD